MKIFWSWQSDRVPKNHHYFVRDALQEACELIASEAEVDESERPEVDHDTKGLAGSPNIAASIAQKIEAAAAFVADMTPVAVTDPAALRPDMSPEKRPAPKYIQNPNVMSELGYAEKTLSVDKIVLVVNAAHFAGPEAMPFDWRHRRGPVFYSLADDADKKVRDRERAALALALRDRLRPILQQRVPPLSSEHVPVSSPGDEALWLGAELGIDLKESLFDRALKKVILEKGPRLFAKVVPGRWPGAAIADLQRQMNQKDARLWIGGRDGTYGRSGEGAFAAQNLTSYAAGYEAGTMTQWFQDSGVIWGVDTTAFSLEDHGRCFAYQAAFSPLASFLAASLEAIRRLGGQDPFTVELGCTKLKEASWPGPLRGSRTPALKDRVLVSRTRSDWSPSQRDQLLWDFWNKLVEAFGFDPAGTLKDFQRAAALAPSTDEVHA